MSIDVESLRAAALRVFLCGVPGVAVPSLAFQVGHHKLAYIVFDNLSFPWSVAAVTGAPLWFGALCYWLASRNFPKSEAGDGGGESFLESAAGQQSIDARIKSMMRWIWATGLIMGWAAVSIGHLVLGGTVDRGIGSLFWLVALGGILVRPARLLDALAPLEIAAARDLKEKPNVVVGLSYLGWGLMLFGVFFGQTMSGKH